jgi:hypothetical protein
MQQRMTRQGGKIMQRLLLLLGGMIAVSGIGVALILGWSGLTPGLSSLMGTDQPRDLGVHRAVSDRQQERVDSSGVSLKPTGKSSEDRVPAPGTKVLDQPEWIETTFTQEEVTALLNDHAPEWLPLRDVQLRLSDETIEVSGLFETQNLPRLLEKLRRHESSEAESVRIADYVGKLPPFVPVYLKATGAVRNAQLDLTLQEIEIGRLGLPVDTLREYVSTSIRETITRTDDFAISAAIPQNGSIAFSGILPNTLNIRKN